MVYETTLQLPNLRTFYSEAVDIPLALNCPRLSELFVYSELTINETTNEQVVHPKPVRSARPEAHLPS